MSTQRGIDFSFVRGKTSTIDNIEKVDGQIILLTDDEDLAFDVKGENGQLKRIKLKGINLTTLVNRVSALEQALASLEQNGYSLLLVKNTSEETNNNNESEAE